MRNSGIVTIVALALMLSVSAAGQPDRVVDLPVEPVRSPITNSLADAARKHDFPTFDSMYRTAVSRHSVAAFDELHALWDWAMTDPIGAFYGQQRYDRYARMFPGYVSFIEEYRIIDSNGNSFFPTAETRKFLLERALSGAPVVTPEPVTRTAIAAPAPDVVESPKLSGEGQIRPVRVPAVPNVEAARPGPAEARPHIAARTAAPSSVVPRVEENASQSNVVPRADRPAEAGPYVVAPPPRAIAAQVVDQVPRDARPAAGSRPDRSGLGRGIFLIIAGLLGVGMLTMMLQTPATRS